MILLFDYTGPAVIALLAFLIFYFIRPVFITKSDRFFFVIVVAEIVGFVANIISSYADNNGPKYYKSLLILLNGIYYTMYVLRYFLFSLYFSSLLQIKNNKNIPFVITSIVTASVIVLIIINPLTQLIYEISPDKIYSPGNLVILIYISNVLTVLLDVYYFILSVRKLNKKDKIAIVISILVLLSCCIIDFFYIQYVISDIFLIIVISILYFIFENPEIYYDKRTGILNIQAFTDSITNNLLNHNKYCIHGFAIKNYNELKKVYGTKQINLVLKEIGDYLLINFSRLNSFYLQKGNFVVIEKNKKCSYDIKQKIENRFNKPWQIKNNTNIQLKIVFINLENTIDFQSFEQMDACVEQAIFESKKNLDKNIIVNRQIFEKVLRKEKVLKLLINALIDNSLKVFLQPIIDSKSRKIIAAEALVRIYDDELGLVPPAEFISMAEENGYIEKLGEQVLNKVCMFIYKENLEQFGIKWINVNLSPIQCLNIKLLENINRITSNNYIDPKFIHLEITEESMIDEQILRAQIKNLINSGYKISLDDFGSGFSNLYSIKAFPFSNIKLDMSLVNEHFNNPDNMLPGIVKIFRDRKLSVTAEGVETKEMADQLTEMGCNYLQGYYFSKPIPEKDFMDLIKHNL